MSMTNLQLEKVHEWKKELSDECSRRQEFSVAFASVDLMDNHMVELISILKRGVREHVAFYGTVEVIDTDGSLQFTSHRIPHSGGATVFQDKKDVYMRLKQDVENNMSVLNSKAILNKLSKVTVYSPKTKDNK